MLPKRLLGEFDSMQKLLDPDPFCSLWCVFADRLGGSRCIDSGREPDDLFVFRGHIGSSLSQISAVLIDRLGGGRQPLDCRRYLQDRSVQCEFVEPLLLAHGLGRGEEGVMLGVRQAGFGGGALGGCGERQERH